MQGETRAPVKDESSGITYDSVVTNREGQVHREFITFEGGAVYPEYVRATLGHFTSASASGPTCKRTREVW